MAIEITCIICATILFLWAFTLLAAGHAARTRPTLHDVYAEVKQMIEEDASK